MKALLKIIVGLATLAAIYKFTPIVQILYLFFMIVCVPIFGLLALGMITEGAYEAMVGPGNDVFNTLREQINKHRAAAEKEPVAAEA